MIDVVLLALHITGEATHAVVHDHDVRFQTLDQVVQRLQRRNDATGGHVDVGTERCNTFLGMSLRVGVHRDVRLVHVGDHGIGDQLLARSLLVDHRFLGNENCDRRTLRIVVLTRDVQDVGADDLGHISENLRETIGVVLFVDVLDITLALFFCTRIADVIDVEAQGLGEVVESLQPQARQRLDHGGRSCRWWERGKYGAKCPPVKRVPRQLGLPLMIGLVKLAR
ncbi:hypothetical protein D3C71_978870 [compost metagenome]